MTTAQREELKNMLVVKRLERVINENTHYSDAIREFCTEVLAWAEAIMDAEKKKQSLATTQSDEMNRCPICGSLNFEIFNEYTTSEGERRRARCNQCHARWVQIVLDGHVVERTNIIKMR